MWLKAVLFIVVALVAIVAGAIAFGSVRWKTGTNELRAKLEATRLPIKQATYDAREIESLPPPVRRYFHAVLKDGQSIVFGVRLAHEGPFNMGETEAKWSPFTSSPLLPSQGVRWEAIDDMTARATLVDGATTVSLNFRFDTEGLWPYWRGRATEVAHLFER